jgi:hypothetical protein
MLFTTLNKLRHFEGKPTLSDDNRICYRDQEWKGIRSKVILQTAAGGIAFMLWFLACLSYLYGTLYLSSERHAAFHVLAVDYDGGVVGQALDAAYTQLKGPGFFTLDFHSPEEYPTEADLHQAVWNGNYWASISATKDASSRLSAALQGGPAAKTYSPFNALHYIWDQQYYTTFANSIIQAHMTQLIAATRLAYNHLNNTHAFNATDPLALQTLLNPIQATPTNIHPTAFGTATFMNSVSMAMPILQQFFFLLVLNGVLGAHALCKKMTVLSSLRFRRVAGLLFTLGAALCQTGYYWAFRESWDVDATKFLLTWMTIWLLMHIHLLILDSIASVAPLPVMPFVVLLWTLVNISSTVSPLEMQAGFYRWGICLPSHEAYAVLVTIWTGGAHDWLGRCLPVLFAWWVAGNVAASLAHVRACHLAKKFEREGEKEGDVEDGLVRQRTVEEMVLERREVYGPSLPPLA